MTWPAAASRTASRPRAATEVDQPAGRMFASEGGVDVEQQAGEGGVGGALAVVTWSHGLCSAGGAPVATIVPRRPSCFLARSSVETVDGKLRTIGGDRDPRHFLRRRPESNVRADNFRRWPGSGPNWVDAGPLPALPRREPHGRLAVSQRRAPAARSGSRGGQRFAGITRASCHILPTVSPRPLDGDHRVGPPTAGPCCWKAKWPLVWVFFSPVGSTTFLPLTIWMWLPSRSLPARNPVSG